MKVLITGGAGFIGTAVANVLRDNGLQVRLFDISMDISPLEGVEKVSGSILDKHMLAEAMRGCDAVVHLAAMLGVKKTETHPLSCLNINIEGSINVFETAVKERVKRVVFSSSSEVYGEAPVDQISETTPINPKSVYAVGKIAAEHYLNGFAKRYGMEYSVVRFFNVYGPGQVAEFVLPRFVKMAQEDIPPTIYGTGEQVRVFCYVEDAARGVHLALTRPEANGQVFNIGNDGEPITVKGLAEKVIAISGKKLPMNFIDLAQSDRTPDREIFVRRPNIAKARQVLGYEPRVSLEEGIRRVMATTIEASWVDPIRIPEKR
ncbi:MAG: NAD-dependent epimerase/dehydratase family protein [Magnetococcales bacterium]|nr:NAD-dependent epimerase/dehydratase family protein [Magnetococcales bacterium]